jgi:RNA polymerase sigma factor (sigma-70 family)
MNQVRLRRRREVSSDMDSAPDRTTQIQLRLDRLRLGDESARDELLNMACQRLSRLARKLTRGYPGVRRWEETDDIFQNAALRLCRALKDVKPTSVRSFINLAAVQIRRELIDLARHYDGPEGMGRHHASRAGVEGAASALSPLDPPADTDDPARLASWTEFHAQVDALPDEEKEVFNLVWYQGLTQAEAAALLGVTERVVKYRWRSARLKLHQMLDGRLPE